MNRELFKKIHDIITPTPDKLDMGSWEGECGTTRCVAGWAIYLTTGQPVYVTDERGNIRQHPSLATLAERLETVIWDKGGEFQEVNVPQLAAKLLDLPHGHRALFYVEDEVALAYVKAVVEDRRADAERLLDLP